MIVPTNAQNPIGCNKNGRWQPFLLRLVSDPRVLSPGNVNRTDAEIEKIAKHQHGLVSWTQLQQLRVTRDQIRRRVRTGQWVRELPGVWRMSWAEPTWMQRGLVRLAVGRTGRVPLPPNSGAALGLGRRQARQSRDQWRNTQAQTWRLVGVPLDRANPKADAENSPGGADHIPSTNVGGPGGRVSRGGARTSGGACLPSGNLECQRGSPGAAAIVNAKR